MSQLHVVGEVNLTYDSNNSFLTEGLQRVYINLHLVGGNLIAETHCNASAWVLREVLQYLRKQKVLSEPFPFVLVGGVIRMRF